jgi:hypothetical protein
LWEGRGARPRARGARRGLPRVGWLCGGARRQLCSPQPGRPTSRSAPLSPPPTAPRQDPIFKGNKVPNLEPGYPGGIFDPLGFSKGNLKELQTKEVKNGRLAMVAFIGFVFAVRAQSFFGSAQLGGRLVSRRVACRAASPAPMQQHPPLASPARPAPPRLAPAPSP